MDTILSVIESFWRPVVNFIPKIPAVILTLIVGYLIIQILIFILNRALKLSRLPRALFGVIVSLALIVMWVILFAEIARE